MSIDLKKIWGNVSPSHRHFTSGEGSVNLSKTKSIIDRADKFIFSNIDKDFVKRSLDWGCGGGILSKEMLQFSSVSLADITEESLNQAKAYVGEENIEYCVELPNQIEKFTFCGPKVDFILCHAVIHHFPSKEYFKSVARVWSSISPRYIGVQIKISNKSFEVEKYSSSNYVTGIVFTEEEFFSDMADLGYYPISKNYFSGRVNYPDQGYYVLEKK